MDENLNNQENNNNQAKQKVPGKGKAIASFILGITAIVFWFFGYSSILSVILGIIGIVLANSAKKEGYSGGLQTAGFVLSIIGLVGGAAAFVACVACVGAVGSLNSLDSIDW